MAISLSSPLLQRRVANRRNVVAHVASVLDFVLPLTITILQMLGNAIKQQAYMRLSPVFTSSIYQHFQNLIIAIMPFPGNSMEKFIPPIIEAPTVWSERVTRMTPFSPTSSPATLSPLVATTNSRSYSASSTPNSYSVSQPLTPEQSLTPISPLISRPLARVKKYTLVLDLDETLVHTMHEQPPVYDFKIPLYSQRECRWFYVLKRPFLDAFLAALSPHYHIVVFTASLRKYADSVIERIDPNNYIEKRLFRSSCLEDPSKGDLIKDLSAVCKNRKRVIMIDNSPTAYSHNEENAIPIETWIDETNDTQLRELIPVLIALRQAEDVRTILRRRALIKEALSGN